jgi:hypothetical protein
MLSHLGYEALVAFATKVFRCAKKQHRRSEGSSTNAVVLFPYTQKELEYPYLTQAALLEWGDCMHCGRAHQSLFIRAQVVDRYKLKSKGHKRMHRKPIETLRTQRNMLLQWSEPGDK